MESEVLDLSSAPSANFSNSFDLFERSESFMRGGLKGREFSEILMSKVANEGEREGKDRLMVKSMFESDCLGVNHYAPYFTICQTGQQLKPSLYGLL